MDNRNDNKREDEGAKILEFPLPVHSVVSETMLDDALALLTYFTRLQDDKRRELLVSTAKHFMVMELAEKKDEPLSQLAGQVLDMKLAKLFQAVGGADLQAVLQKHIFPLD